MHLLVTDLVCSKEDNNQDDDDAILSLTKQKTADFSFDDGLLFRLPDSKPKHVQFFCKSDDALTESCDLRLFQLLKESKSVTEGQQN